jgi:hypothetical protein
MGHFGPYSPRPNYSRSQPVDYSQQQPAAVQQPEGKPGLFFEYADTLVLGANAQGKSTIAINAGADFRVRYLLAFSTGPFTAQIFNGSSRRPFSSVPVHRDLLFGTAQNPFYLLVPYTFPQGVQIETTLQDLSGAQNTIWIAFGGEELVDTVDGQ